MWLKNPDFLGEFQWNDPFEKTCIYFIKTFSNSCLIAFTDPNGR